MGYKVSLLFVLITALDCGAQAQDGSQFLDQLKSLKSYFHIPGMASLVIKDNEIIFEEYLGFADVENQVPVDANTLFPIASITKSISMVPVLNLVEQGLIALDTPLQTYLPDIDIPNDVTVRHILSHTSEYIPGTMYNYTPRIGLIKPVAEQVSALTFEELMAQYVLDPLQLEHTTLMRDERDFAGRKVAKPYTFYGTTEPGQYEFGFSPTAGLAATPRDLASIDVSINSGQILASSRLEEMYMPSTSNSGQSLPYGLGIFSQNLLGLPVVWSYGQYDCFSSLYLKVPSRNMTFILLANNNLISDPPRMIYGDAAYNRFALAFMDQFLGDVIESDASIRKNQLSRLLAASFMGQGFEGELDTADQILSRLMPDQDDICAEEGLSLLHACMQLKEMTNRRTYDSWIVKLFDNVSAKTPHNPYLLFYRGTFAQLNGDTEACISSFESLTTMPNMHWWWYLVMAHSWLGDYYFDTNPNKAAYHYKTIIDGGWNISGRIDHAKSQIERMK